MAEELKNLMTEMREAFDAMQTAAKKDNEALMNKAEEAYAQAKKSADALAKAEESEKKIFDRLDQIEANLKAADMDGVHGAKKALNEYDKAFKDALRSGENANSVLLNSIARKCYAALMETPDTSGGYLVQPELAREIIGGIEEYNIFRDVAEVVTIGGNAYQQPVWPTPATMHVASNDAADIGTPAAAALQMVDIPVADCDVTIPVTRDIVADTSYDLEGFMTRQAAIAFGNGEMSAFSVGAGSGKIQGLFSVSAAADSSNPAFGTAGYIASGNADTIPNADPLIDMIAALKSTYRRNGSFMAASMTISALRKLKKSTASDGYLIWTPSLTAGVPDLLLNKPLHENDFAPAVDSGNLPIAFGDFKRAYTIVDRQQMFLLVTVNNQSKRVLDYTWFHRVGGAVTDTRAVKFLKIATA